MNCFKILLHLFNVVFIMGGIVFIGIGSWTAVDKIYVSFLIGDTLFSAASYLLIAVGVVTMFVCIFGIYATVKEKKNLLIIYFCVLCLAAVLMLLAGIVAVVFKSEVESAMVDEMRKTLINNYGSDTEVTDAWDQVQRELKCCAVSETLIGGGSSLYRGPYVDNTSPQVQAEKDAQDSFPMYKRTQWFRDQNDLMSDKKKYVPLSCCVKKSGDYLSKLYCQSFPGGPPSNYAFNALNDNIYYDGCYQKAKSLVMDQADILVAFGFVFAFVMISGIVLTFLILRGIRNDENHTKRRREPDNL